MAELINREDAIAQVHDWLVAGELAQAVAYLRELHPADSAEILAGLEPEQQSLLVDQLDPEELAGLFDQMDGEDAAEFLQHFNYQDLAAVLDEMEPDSAADLLGELEPQDASAVLDQMEGSEAVAPLLTYPEDSAGGIMNVAPPALRRQMSIAEAFDFIRQHYRDAEEVFYLYVVDRNDCLIGIVNLRALILAESHQTIEDIMLRDVFTIRVDMDQEAVAELFSRYDLLALPVVDEEGRLVGVITVDDVVDVLQEEATEDIYHLAQVGPSSDIFSSVPRSLRNRMPWLYVNMGTAIVASTVVAFFESTIATVALLAIFMPIVATLGGNAGNQTMTIVVRSLALGEMSLGNAWKVLRREMVIGLLNGIALGLSMGLVAWYWKGNPMLGLLVGLALLANMSVAAINGVLVPTTLKRLGIDPALASSIFVTTVNDMVGFGVFLGLATYFLAWLR
ncbi:MAG: magnesium transporter [Litorilinea sp.]